MKSLIFALIVSLLPISGFAADCNYTTDIKENPDGSYNYSRGCHIEVGKKVKGYTLLDQENKELRLVIEQKDIVIQKSEERIKLWMDTSFEVQNKLMQYERARDMDKWLHFGLGVVVTGAAVYGASRLAK